MDINAFINTQPLFAPNRPVENALNLKVGQQLEAKVGGADMQAANNTVTLTLGNKEITVQSNQPIALSPGQDLKIQVTQIAPTVEFKILDSLAALKAQAMQLQDTAELRLKLIPTARDGGSVASDRESMRPTAKDGGSAAGDRESMRPTAGDGGRPTAMDAGSAASGRAAGTAVIGGKPESTPLSSPASQPLDAKIVGIVGTKIQLQVFTPSTAKQTALLTIDRAQLNNAPSDLKVGQNLSLEIIKTGTAPEFKIISAASNIPEAKVAGFIKQFLPRHEAAPLFLNQLIKDLPKLMQNESVPQSLKDIAAKIIQNLPPKEQLITSQGLKQAIVNSGLFLEAKLSPAMAQELPQLIKNESVPQSLQRIAAEILQSLSQKGSKLESTAPGLNSANGGMDAKNADKMQPPTKAGALTEATDTAGKSAIQGASAEDFKANLLKFIHALKQELSPQSEQQRTQLGLDLLENLQNKTENTVAKLVLDQLMSLPKDDTPKQQWIIDIPFIDRQQAESVKIEIQQDKGNKQQSGSNGDWSVNITITPPELGTIHCMVTYRNDAINTFFKSRNTQTTELIKHNLDYLKNQLEESGLTTGHMDAHAGSQKNQAPHQLAGKNLFDDKA